jgi:AbrB family looped-hinge helix DNA binding protein
MVNIAVSKMSSKGQVVIPNSIRKNFKIGENIVFVEKNGEILLKNMNDFSKKFQEDFSRAKKYTSMIEAYERGELETVDFKNVEDAVKYLDDLDKNGGKI